MSVCSAVRNMDSQLWKKVFQAIRSGSQQAADDLGLEGCQLGSDIHKGNATLVNCSAGDIPAGVQMCCPCHHWPVGCHEGVTLLYRAA